MNELFLGFFIAKIKLIDFFCSFQVFRMIIEKNLINIIQFPNMKKSLKKQYNKRLKFTRLFKKYKTFQQKKLVMSNLLNLDSKFQNKAGNE